MYLIDMIRLNVAKNTNYIEKCLKQKLCKLHFLKKISLNAYLYVPQSGATGAPKICVFEILYCTEMKTFTLGLNVAKNTDYCLYEKILETKVAQN